MLKCEVCLGPIHPCYANYVQMECEDCFALRMSRVKTTLPRRVEESTPNDLAYVIHQQLALDSA